MKVITFCSEKGGTGKSSSLILIARAVAEQLNENYALPAGNPVERHEFVQEIEPDGVQERVFRRFVPERKKVLVIDLDTLGSSSMHFKPDNLKEQDVYNKKHVAAAITDDSDTSLRDYIVSSSYDGIDLLRSSESIRRINFTQNLIRNKIRGASLGDFYDFVFIDTPAAYNPLHISALTAADTIVTPVNASLFDYSASEHLEKWIEQDISENADWHFFFTMMQPENKGQAEYVDLFKDKFGPERFYNFEIPHTVKVTYSIDRKYMISHYVAFSKLRTALCGLASAITGIPVDPKERF